MFRWQVSFDDATTAMDHPRLVQELFVHSFCDAGGCTLQERCWCALILQLDTLSCGATCKGGVRLGRPRMLFGPVFLRASQNGGQ